MTFRFDLTDLRLFLNVVDAGSITAGAEASTLGLAAASARVLAMESSLGAALLTREARGVQPTAAGQALVLHARTLLLQMERLHGGLAEHVQGIKLQLRLLCDTVALHEVVPERLAAFLLAHPGVNLLVDERPSNEVVSALAEGTADVGIVRDSTDVFELESLVFHPDRLVLVTPPGHALLQAAAQAPVRLAQADRCDVVGLTQGTALQDLWDHHAAQRGRRLNYRIRVGSFDEQCRLVARGAGIALMPQTTAERQAQMLDMGIVPLAETFAAFALRLCARSLDNLPATTRRLVGSLLGREAPPPSAMARCLDGSSFHRHGAGMSPHFDLTDLRLFLNIVDGGSITAGAAATHLSLAACSERVAGMERSLATPLLTRGRRGVRPTAAGLALAQHARGVLQQAERLQLDLQEHAKGLKGHITLHGTSAAIREYLPDALGDYLARHPQVNVSVAEAVGDDAVQAVRDGSADIAFVTDRTAAQGLTSFHFVMNRFALVVPRGHRLALESKGRPISITRGDTCDVVGLPVGSALQDAWDKRAADRGVSLNYRVRVPGFDAQLRLIERGIGVAMLPEATARRGSRHRAVEVLPLSDPYLVRELLICVRDLSALPPYTRALVEQLRGAHQPPANGQDVAQTRG